MPHDLPIDMTPLDLIVAKRDGRAHSPSELDWLIDGVVAGSIPDYQLAAWLMAVVWRGMTPAETAALTHAMAYSGTVLDLSDLPGPLVDKHSTGGVGDKTSLVVGPLAAATGLTVAKMSGRGLGHTGGTLDKLESIPGLTVNLDLDRFRRQAAQIGLVIAGQSADLAPADGKLYALRDVTGTVPSLPLIAASIMSKKIAAGAGAIALDVKVGAGAFMPTPASARALAETMVELGTHAGRRVAAALTRMDQPLGLAVGNALEVREAIDTLRGQGPADFVELCMVMAGLMHRVGANTYDGADSADLAAINEKLKAAIDSGRAFEKFVAMVRAQGGDPRAVEQPDRLPQAPVQLPVAAPRHGHVVGLNAREVGEAVVELGAGRKTKGDPVDPAVGVVLAHKVGDSVVAGEPLAIIHARNDSAAAAAAARIVTAYIIADESVSVPPLIFGYVGTQVASSQ